MAKTKLKDLEVTEVSLVDAGANQHAHVALYKRNGGKPEEQSAGQEPGQTPAKSGLHKFFSAIGKALKLDQADIDSAVADIEKADTFNDKMEERKLRRITDEIWDVCFALENSLCSIIRDEEVTDKAALMNQSIDEFDVAIKSLVTSWGAGKTAQIVKTADAVSVEHMQETVDRLGGMIEKATGKQQPPATEDPVQEGGETPPEDNGKTKTKKSIGGETDMKFNEANMTATDRMAFEELKKRYGIEDGAEGAGAGAGKIYHVLTGTGPLTWSHNKQLDGIWDLNGNVSEWTGALRTVKGELQALENNNGANSDNPQTATSTAWKAIDATTGAFITPDGNGTTANSIKIDATGAGGAQWCKTITKTSENFSCALGALTCSADISDTAKAVLRAYGLLPVDGAKASDYDDDRLWFNNVADERLFYSGGGYGFGGNAGVGYSGGDWTGRGGVGVYIGFRSAYVDLESVGL